MMLPSTISSNTTSAFSLSWGTAVSPGAEVVDLDCQRRAGHQMAASAT
ncbi:MAG: hypothetical protein R2711_09995 [Acidimicrobiales bacterium]